MDGNTRGIIGQMNGKAFNGDNRPQNDERAEQTCFAQGGQDVTKNLRVKNNGRGPDENTRMFAASG